MTAQAWTPGTVVVRREVWRGRAWLGHPLYVVEDSTDLLVLYQPEGSPWGFGAGHDWPTATGRHPYDGRRAWVGEGPLGLHRAGDPHAVWAYWSPPPERRFMGWYVNIQVPYRRTAIGVDTLDLELDLVVSPDLRVTMKDEDHVDRSAALGRFTVDDAQRIHSLGAELRTTIERGDLWWDESWSTWEPPPELREAPALGDAWDLEPAAEVADLLAPE